jgi:hypothetical protein
MRLAAATLCTLALTAAPAAGQSGAEPIDCTGPAPSAQPGTRAWRQREAANAYCATQRNLDTHSNPLYLAANAMRPFPDRATTAMDPLREPRALDGKRFRFDELSFTSAAGKAYPAMLFRPLAQTPPPYPGVVIMHGGAANQEMYWWAAEGLAEAGYMVLTVNIGRTDGGHYEATRDGLGGEWRRTGARDEEDGGPRRSSLPRISARRRSRPLLSERAAAGSLGVVRRVHRHW